MRRCGDASRRLPVDLGAEETGTRR